MLALEEPSKAPTDSAMKIAERLVLAQWSLLLALAIVMALALRPVHVVKDSQCENVSRYDVVLATGVGNSSVPVVTQAHFVQAPCSPPYSMKVMSYRQGGKDETAFVLHIQLIAVPEDTGKDLEKSGPPHWQHERSAHERDAVSDRRMSMHPHRTRQLTLYHEPRTQDYMYDPHPEPSLPEKHYNHFPSEMTAKPVTPLPAAPAQIPTPTSQPPATTNHDLHTRRSDMKPPKTDSNERRKPYSDADDQWRTYSTIKPFMVLPAKKLSPLK